MPPEQKLELEERRLEAALEELRERPDALLCLEVEIEDWDFDIPSEIAGLPVYFSSHLINETYRQERMYKKIPWVPIWKKSAHLDSIGAFNAAYLETE